MQKEVVTMPVYPFSGVVHPFSYRQDTTQKIAEVPHLERLWVKTQGAFVGVQ